MPGYKVFLEEGGEIREGLTCAYCKLLLKDPVQTTESGLRLCRRCFEEATKSPTHDCGLDLNDGVWPDSAVKREITNLRVKCENYDVGCDWKGLFKQLMQHSQECQYVTVECSNTGCGQKVVKAKMEAHLKEECVYQQVNCKDCGKKMHLIELQDHAGVCPNALKACKNCGEEVLAHKLLDHMIHECKLVRCVCSKENNVYKINSTKFHNHLQDSSKLADHLEPMIREVTKMSEAFKEMTTAYQQATNRIDILEKSHQRNIQRIDTLEKYHQEDTQRIDTLTKKITFLEKWQESAQRTVILEKKEIHQKIDRCLQESQRTETKITKLELAVKSFIQNDTMDQINYRVRQAEDNIKRLENKVSEMKKDFHDIKMRLQDINIAAMSLSSDEVKLHKMPLESLRDLEEKVLELERIINALSSHCIGNMEPRLISSLNSTHNGALLWHITEVRQQIQNAKKTDNVMIDSPPFYTGRYGYKMCIRAYLNGAGSGEGTHFSIFLVLMKGEHDKLLQWPFQSKVNLILIDQLHKKHLIQTFKPNPRSSSFQRPKTDMNVASGFPEFADLAVLDIPSYVDNDEMFIKAVVDTSDIFHP